MTDPLDAWMSATQARGVLLAHSVLPADWAFRLPPSPRVGVHAVLRGHAWLVVDGHEPTHMQAGDVVLLPSGPAHRIGSSVEQPAIDISAAVDAMEDGPVSLLCGEYAGSRCPVTSLWRDLPDIVHLSHDELAAEPRIAAVLDMLRTEVARDAAGSEALIASLLDALFVYLMRVWSSSGRAGWHRALGSPELATTLRQLHGRPAHPWTVDDLARTAGMSRAVFSRTFSESMGEPPMTYLRRWRMAVAARLLLEDGAVVGDVAERVGYSSEFAFNRAFKKVIGSPPGRYRRQQAVSP